MWDAKAEWGKGFSVKSQQSKKTKLTQVALRHFHGHAAGTVKRMT